MNPDDQKYNQELPQSFSDEINNPSNIVSNTNSSVSSPTTPISNNQVFADPTIGVKKTSIDDSFVYPNAEVVDDKKRPNKGILKVIAVIVAIFLFLIIASIVGAY